MTRTRDQIRVTLTDAHIVATLGPQALTAMTAALCGYPASTPGAAPASPSPLPEYNGPCQERLEVEAATDVMLRVQCGHQRPCPEHDSALALTQPERLASTTDKAGNDLASFQAALRQAQQALSKAARIATRWGTPGLNESAVKDRLLVIDRDIWCSSCSRFGEHNPRRENGRRCEFCQVFHATYGREPHKAIFDARNARGGRLSVTDIERILNRDYPDWRKKKKRSA